MPDETFSPLPDETCSPLIFPVSDKEEEFVPELIPLEEIQAIIHSTDVEDTETDTYGVTLYGKELRLIYWAFDIVRANRPLNEQEEFDILELLTYLESETDVPVPSLRTNPSNPISFNRKAPAKVRYNPNRDLFLPPVDE